MTAHNILPNDENGIPYRCGGCKTWPCKCPSPEPIAAGGGEETRGQKLAKQIEGMAPHVGMKFTPDPEKIAQFDKPSPSSSDLVERLRRLGHEYRHECPEDTGFQILEAADTITALQSELEISHARYLNYDELATAEIKSLQSEVAEWRLALENIRDGHTFGIKPSEIARAALAGKD
jgi:hypothetical protein